jgi:hypothetical protein
VLRRPELHWHPYRREAVGGKEDCARVGEGGRFDARVVHDRLRGEFLPTGLLAPRICSRRVLAKFAGDSPIRIGADQDECRVTARRDAEDADALRIDPGCRRRSAEHEIDQALDVGRPLDEFRQIAGTAHIQGIIPGMSDPGDDEPGVSERLGCVVMGNRDAAIAMRDHNERQLVVRERTILHAGHDHAAEVDLA